MLHRGDDRAIAKRAAERGLTAFAVSEFALEPRHPADWCSASPAGRRPGSGMR